MKIPSVVISGDVSQAGTYILRIRLKEDTALTFGGFKKGRPISLGAGDYTYVGSALSEKGATSLARRLTRHATRSADKPPHLIRAEMIRCFIECGLEPRNPLPKHDKTLHWNIDFLLDLQCAEIINVLAVRSPERLEVKIGRHLENDPCTEIIEAGLGANDTSRSTHLLRIDAGETWWASLIDNITDCFES